MLGNIYAMPKATLYKIAPSNSRLIDAQLEFERITDTSAAVILHSRAGNPVKNPEYAEALVHVLQRLLPDNRLVAVLIDSSDLKLKDLSPTDRTLCLGSDLAGVEAYEAAKLIRSKALRFGQAEGIKGGNSTKRLRIESRFPLHSLITTLHVHRVGSQQGDQLKPSNHAVSRAQAKQMLADVPHTDEELACVENEMRMAEHFRRERSRSNKLPKAKRKAVREANGGRYSCENENCPVDWYSVFPAHVAEGVFEVHHRVPLSQLEQAVENKVADLQMLCASCHRAEHRRLSSI